MNSPGDTLKMAPSPGGGFEEIHIFASCVLAISSSRMSARIWEKRWLSAKVFRLERFVELLLVWIGGGGIGILERSPSEGLVEEGLI